jgi:hypothetical protein
MREAALRNVFDKFSGYCHFCGGEIRLHKRGWAADLAGRWKADHVIQRRKGGSNDPHNFLPACTRCNRLRWGRSGSSLRRALFLGLVAKYAAHHYQESTIGAQLRSMRIQRLSENWHRRMQKELARQKQDLSKQEFRVKAARLKTAQS